MLLNSCKTDMETEAGRGKAKYKVTQQILGRIHAKQRFPCSADR